MSRTKLLLGLLIVIAILVESESRRHPNKKKKHKKKWIDLMDPRFNIGLSQSAALELEPHPTSCQGVMEVEAWDGIHQPECHYEAENMSIVHGRLLERDISKSLAEAVMCIVLRNVDTYNMYFWGVKTVEN